MGCGWGKICCGLMVVGLGEGYLGFIIDFVFIEKDLNIFWVFLFLCC